MAAGGKPATKVTVESSVHQKWPVASLNRWHDCTLYRTVNDPAYNVAWASSLHMQTAIGQDGDVAVLRPVFFGAGAVSSSI